MGLGHILTNARDSGYSILEKCRKIGRANVERNLMKQRTHGDVLTEAQKREAKDFWAPYMKRPHLLAHQYYTEKNGEFFPEYIPSDFYYTKIDTYFNDWNQARVIDNKCYYDLYLPKIKQPGVVAKRINGYWFDADGRWISEAEGWQRIADTPACFAKISRESCGGSGIWFLSTEEEKEHFRRAEGMRKDDFLFQLPVKQHPQISAIYPHSINTIRVISLLRKDDVKIYSMVIRMGRGNMIVDNLTSGGMSCGITEDNRLKRFAYTSKGERCDRHPDTGTVFDGYLLPSIDRVRRLVKDNHCALPHFRLMSWDFAIDEEADPVLIEVNMSYGDLDCHQFNNGPLFGEDTKSILNEIKMKNKKAYK